MCNRSLRQNAWTFYTTDLAHVIIFADLSNKAKNWVIPGWFWHWTITKWCNKKQLTTRSKILISYTHNKPIFSQLLIDVGNGHGNEYVGDKIGRYVLLWVRLTSESCGIPLLRHHMEPMRTLTLAAVSIGGSIDLGMKWGRKRKRNKYAINHVARGHIGVYREHCARWFNYSYRVVHR